MCCLPFHFHLIVGDICNVYVIQGLVNLCVCAVFRSKGHKSFFLYRERGRERERERERREGEREERERGREGEREEIDASLLIK